MIDLVRRNARWIQLAALGLMLLSLVLVLRQAPIAELDAALRTWIRGVGPWAPLAFVGIYIATAMVLLPASVLTVIAGALWGPLVGTAYTMIGAAIAVTASFLVARYAARDQMIALARRSPRFRAIDEAITEGGWRIIGLVRLTPVFPFGVQNYLYGLTGVRFWPAILVSLPAMLPGTLFYIYLGHLTREGATAAAEGDVNGWIWALRGLGVVAAVAVIAYLGTLARRRLRELTRRGDTLDQEEPDMNDTDSTRGILPWKTIALATLAVVMLGGSLYAQFRPDLVRGLVAGALGPAAVNATEAYEARPDGPTVDHRRLAAVLQRVVTPDGMVDYERLRGEPADDLRAYLDQLASITPEQFDALGRDEKLALLINAYNAWTLQLILDHWPVASIRDIPANQRWKADRWRLAGRTFSLDELEHQWLREKFVEPRIHFAIVCASVGCPPLRDEPFTGERIDQQLEEQTRLVHTDGSRWFDYDPASNTLRLTPLYDWFAGDFERVAGSPVAFAARYSPELQHTLDAGEPPRIEWMEYDWSLNRPRNSQ